jgi:hypothetical protein
MRKDYYRDGILPWTIAHKIFLQIVQKYRYHLPVRSITENSYEKR